MLPALRSSATRVRGGARSFSGAGAWRGCHVIPSAAAQWGERGGETTQRAEAGRATGCGHHRDRG